jgi:hypothetical protein
MTPPTVDNYGTPTLSIEEVFPAKNNNDGAVSFAKNNNIDEEHFLVDSSIKKTWSEFEHFPVNAQVTKKKNQQNPSNENEFITSADADEATTMSGVTSNSTSVSTSIFVVLNTRYNFLSRFMQIEAEKFVLSAN